MLDDGVCDSLGEEGEVAPLGVLLNGEVFVSNRRSTSPKDKRKNDLNAAKQSFKLDICIYIIYIFVIHMKNFN